MIDPILVIIRVAEALAVALKMALAVGHNTASDEQLGFAFRWRSLKGRQLSAWANPMYDVLGLNICYEDEAVSELQIPMSTPVSALAPYVKEATEELFRLFNGTRIPDNVYEQFTKAVLERRL